MAYTVDTLMDSLEENMMKTEDSPLRSHKRVPDLASQ